MKFHALAGSVRSGSTLLCNVLQQNPRFFASDTGCMAQSARSLSNLWTHSPEMKSELMNDDKLATEAMVKSSRSMIEGFYSVRAPDAEVVFDKCRSWNHSSLLFNQLFPDSTLFVCVRDLRNVFASAEKQHAKNPIIDEAAGPLGLTTLGRCKRLFAQDGVIGHHVLGVEDLIRRRLPFVEIIQYETFCRHPQRIIDSIYDRIGEEPFEHDFENVINRAQDQDWLYGGKWPHEGAGKIEPKPDDWPKHVSTDIAADIIASFPKYNQEFGYR